MGFCRRCGEIVHGGERCKCGGTAVVGTVAWKESQDPWTKTYVSRDKSPTRPSRPSVDTSGDASAGITRTNTSPTKRFPRPLSSYSSSSSSSNSIGKRVTEHITATTSQLNRPPSPLKNSTVVSPEEGILPSLNYHTTGSLAKVYGSVLQSKESLASHACAYCGTPFPPDGTIYPEPHGETSNPARFLCRDCFTSNGGAKGQCPGCSRPVLALKSEGQFIEAAGAYWHKKCFVCRCGTYIGDSPMVDLLGKPSCPDCFDDCLKRDSTPKRNRNSVARLGSPSPNIGGVSTRSPRPKSREGSPALEELEQRLGIVKGRQSSPALEELEQCHGIVKRRQSSPALEELTHRLSLLATSPNALSRSPSPRRSTATPDDSPLLNRSLRSSRSGLVTEIAYRDDTRSKGSTSHRAGSSSPTFRPTVTQIEDMDPRVFRPLFQTSPVESSVPALDRPSPTQIIKSPSLPSLPLADSDASPPENLVPDLVSDYSDSATQSSVGPDSPPRQLDEPFLPAKRRAHGFGIRTTASTFFEDNDVIIEETNSQLNTPDNTPKRKPVSSGEIITPSKTQTYSGKSPSYLPRPRSSGSMGGHNASPTLKPNSCAKCGKQLFSVHEGGKYVTVPVNADTTKTYHTACFTCSVCGLEFKQNAHGQTAFVKTDGGPCHIECAPQEKLIVRKTPDPLAQPLPTRRTHAISKSISSLPSSSSPNTGSYVSSRYSPPVSAPAISSSTSVPRFGGASSCPGCKKSVSQVSFGISEGERSVQGPNGTRWHRNCLVCGGKKEPSKGLILRGRDERKQNEPGCGKRLDSGAKTLGESGVYCRECWLLLPATSSSPERSPTRTPTTQIYTGSPGKVVPQLTGTTTLARQFTGLSGGDGTAPLLRQLTGGGLSPTRSLSPTKQLGSFKPRPKSVIGMRPSRSVDESRGMFLVRQLTGSGK